MHGLPPNYSLLHLLPCYFFCDFFFFLSACSIPVYVQNLYLPGLPWSQDIINYLFFYTFILTTCTASHWEQIVCHTDNPKSNDLFYAFRYCCSGCDTEHSLLESFLFLLASVIPSSWSVSLFSLCGNSSISNKFQCPKAQY